MGGISVMLLIGMLSAMYVFFIAVIAVLIIYFAVALFVVSPIPLLSDAIAFLLKLFLKILNGSISFIHDLPFSLTFLSIHLMYKISIYCLIDL